MKTETLFNHFYQHLDNAYLDAKTYATDNNKQVYIIEVYGYGFKIVPSNFILDRNYYHGEGGKKMFFELKETVQ